MDGIVIRVSDHAVVRWMERRHGIDLEPLREEIRARPASGGFARDKMVIRALPKARVRAMRDEMHGALVAAFDREGLDRAARMEARAVDVGDGWRLALSPHPGGRSVATVIEPGMEHGDPRKRVKKDQT